MRNPYRWSFDRQTGDMYVGDVGAAAREEVTFLPRAQSAGANLGWNCFEGNIVGPGGCSPPNHRPPAYDYESNGNVVIGGYVIHDPAFSAAFQGRYLFGDYSTGQLQTLGPGATGTAADTGADVAQLTAFGEDGIGRLYAASQQGPVYRLTASGVNVQTTPIGSFAEPAAIAAPPGDPDRLFIAELGGRVKLIAAGQVHEFLDIDADILSGGERGLLAVAIAPDYAASGRVYVFYTDNGGDLRLDEVRRSSADANRADPATRRNLLTIEHSSAGNHNGGQLQFGPDGYLYLSTGDGGGDSDLNGDAQNPGSLLGKILRIDVDPTPPALSVPLVDSTAPSLDTRVKRRQRVLRLRGAVAYATCSEPCTITAGGTLRIGGRGLRLRQVSRAEVDRRVRLKVRLTRRATRVLRRALRRERRVSVRVGLRARDAAGNRSRLVRATVRVKR